MGGLAHFFACLEGIYLPAQPGFGIAVLVRAIIAESVPAYRFAGVW